MHVACRIQARCVFFESSSEFDFLQLPFVFSDIAGRQSSLHIIVSEAVYCFFFKESHGLSPYAWPYARIERTQGHPHQPARAARGRYDNAGRKLPESMAKFAGIHTGLRCANRIYSIT